MAQVNTPPVDADEELNRRLDVIEDPSYLDPAQRDLSALDYLLLVAINVALVGAMLWYAWG